MARLYVVTGEKRYQAFAWRDAFAGSAFDPLEHEVFPHESEVPRDVLIARIGSCARG